MGAVAKREPVRAHTPPALVDDLRFRRLLGAHGWRHLPLAVQRRFALLAQACRAIGAPLPLDRASGMAAVVTVTEDSQGGGQVWSRLYARPRGFPQVIHSAKRFAGPTQALDRGLRFTSDHYFVRLGDHRLRLPAWLGPGRLDIDHEDRGAGRFSFTLTLRHRLFGLLMRQHSLFVDQGEIR
jgi:hypothetical protein